MIELKLANDDFKKSKNILNDVYLAYDKEKLLGYCEFEINLHIGKIHTISTDDVSLKDGLLRQTLFYMAQKMCLIAELDENLYNELSSLYIISKNQKEINISEFFSKPCHGKTI